MQNDVLRPDQAMKRLNCSRSMVYKLIKNGDVEAFRVGSTWRIIGDSLEHYKQKSHTKHISHDKC